MWRSSRVREENGWEEGIDGGSAGTRRARFGLRSIVVIGHDGHRWEHETAAGRMIGIMRSLFSPFELTESID